MSFTLLLFIYSAIQATKADCPTWTSANGDVFDMSCLSNVTLDGYTDDEGYSYEWSLCRNDLSCGSESAMVTQRKGEVCHILAKYDDQLAPTYTDGEGWTFKYNNGDSDCGNPARTWAPTFVCDPDTDYEVIGMTEIPGSCYYDVTIASKYACPDIEYECLIPNPFDCSPVYTVRVVDAKGTPLNAKRWINAYVEVYGIVGKDGIVSNIYQKMTTTIKDDTIWEELFSFDEDVLGDEYEFSAFKFEVLNELDDADGFILADGLTELLGATKPFYTKDITRCDEVYAKQIKLLRRNPLFDKQEKTGHLFVEITMSGCCDGDGVRIQSESDESSDDKRSYDRSRSKSRSRRRDSGGLCKAHSDCPSSEPFCYDGECDKCSECEYCGDGVDGTCGPCGDGYPTMEDGPCRQ